jgi:hypothetical protein
MCNVLKTPFVLGKKLCFGNWKKMVPAAGKYWWAVGVLAGKEQIFRKPQSKAKRQDGRTGQPFCFLKITYLG